MRNKNLFSFFPFSVCKEKKRRAMVVSTPVLLKAQTVIKKGKKSGTVSRNPPLADTDETEKKMLFNPFYTRLEGKKRDGAGGGGTVGGEEKKGARSSVCPRRKAAKKEGRRMFYFSIRGKGGKKSHACGGGEKIFHETGVLGWKKKKPHFYLRKNF